MNNEQLGRIAALIGKDRETLPAAWLPSYEKKRRTMQYPPYRVFISGGGTAVFETYREAARAALAESSLLLVMYAEVWKDGSPYASLKITRSFFEQHPARERPRDFHWPSDLAPRPNERDGLWSWFGR